MFTFTKIILIFSLIFIVGRFTVAGHTLSAAGSYEALAHIWVGFLIAFCLQEAVWALKWMRGDIINPTPSSSGLASISLIVMTAVEVFMFVHQGWFAAMLGQN